MPYVEDRVIHDADAHTMEPPEWLDGFGSKSVVDYVHEHFTIGDNEPVFREDRTMPVPARRSRVPGSRRGGNHAAQELSGHRRLGSGRSAARLSTISASPAS